MSEATVVLKELNHSEAGWYEFVDANGTKYSTKKEQIVEPARNGEGKAFLLEFTEKQNGKYTNRYLDAVRPAPEDPKEKLGTGEYIGAQKAPADKQAIARSVALKAAVDSFESAPLAASPKQISDKVGPLAQAYEVYLNTGKWPGHLAEDDIPF